MKNCPKINPLAFVLPDKYLGEIDPVGFRRRIKSTKHNTSTSTGLEYMKFQKGLLKKHNTFLETYERNSQISVHWAHVRVQMYRHAKYPEMYHPVPPSVLNSYRLLHILGEFF